MNGAVAAGHPRTAEAGARILEEGGNAVDAAVAAAFAAWVAESPLSGPGAGGFALVRPADGRPARVADFFVAEPGLGQPRPGGAMEAVDIGFGAGGEAIQVFRIGGASCAVPGAPAGLASVHRAYGRLPWPAVVEPALELARSGVILNREQAHLHAILDLILRHLPEGRRVYSNADGGRLQPGERLQLTDLAGTLEWIAADGVADLYTGGRARRIVETVAAAGGTIGLEDLASYRVVWRRPVEARFRRHLVISNPPPSSGGVLIAYGLALLEQLPDAAEGGADAIEALVRVMREQARARLDGFSSGLQRGGLARKLLAQPALARALARMATDAPAPAEPAPPSGTTHVSVVDAEGNAAAITSSTGSGSGVIVPGTAIHLNNMLGEYDLAAGGAPRPGRRLTSMMAPTIVVGEGGPRLVVGSAGSVRLRGAIMQVVVNVLEHGLAVASAIDRPRVHVDGEHVHCEGGFEPAVLDQLAARGYDVVRWRRRNLYFGGANAVEVTPEGLAAAGDARRGGGSVVVSDTH